jgi:hypothetical protein
MAKDDTVPALIGINQRLDALDRRLKIVERQLVNPAANEAAHTELRELLATYGLQLPPRDETFNQFDPADVDAFYARIRAQPGAQDHHGVCPSHERAIERFGTLFRHMGWSL